MASPIEMNTGCVVAAPCGTPPRNGLVAGSDDPMVRCCASAERAIVAASSVAATSRMNGVGVTEASGKVRRQGQRAKVLQAYIAKADLAVGLGRSILCVWAAS